MMGRSGVKGFWVINTKIHLFVSMDHTALQWILIYPLWCKNVSGRSFCGMLVKANLLTGYSAEVLRLCTTSSWHGWLPSKPFGWPPLCLGHWCQRMMKAGDSSRTQGRGNQLLQKHCFLTLGNLLPLQLFLPQVQTKLGKHTLAQNIPSPIS